MFPCEAFKGDATFLSREREKITKWQTETMNAETNDWLKSDDSREYFELLRIPTVGAEPLHLRDCVSAAAGLKKWLGGVGVSAERVVPRVRGAKAEGEGRSVDSSSFVPVVVA